MEYYLVGGAVRDIVLGKEPKDRDYVVIGETPESMEEKGFKQVGKGFPVFLDDQGDEYALARTEQKTDDGYYGFDCNWEGVTLEEDLRRRDFTINAMAVPREKEYSFAEHDIIDPFGGIEDAKSGVIRHVSEAFKEDPLRVLRMARFATRLEFVIDEHTLEICLEVLPELDCLPHERHGEEIEKACEQSKDIKRYFRVLYNLEALDHIMPQLQQLTFVPAGYGNKHQEGTAFDHTLLVLEEMEKIRPNDVKAYLMAIAHDLGKYVTYREDGKNHGGHDKAGIDRAENLADHLRFSNEYKEAMKIASKDHLRFLNIPKMRSGKTVKYVSRLDKEYIDLLSDLCVADKRGRIPPQEVDLDEIHRHIDAAQQAIEEWTGKRLKETGYEGTGEKFGMTLLNRRQSRYKEIVNGER